MIQKRHSSSVSCLKRCLGMFWVSRKTHREQLVLFNWTFWVKTLMQSSFQTATQRGS